MLLGGLPQPSYTGTSSPATMLASLSAASGSRSGRSVPTPANERCTATWSSPRKIKPCILSTLHNGESIYVHCMAGVHRAPCVAGIIVAHSRRSLKVGITTLSEFRFLKRDDELLAAFFTPVKGDLSNEPLRKARLRQAWNAVCQAEQQREDKGTHVSVSLYEEDVLPSQQLAKIREVFWKRYHIWCFHQRSAPETSGSPRPSAVSQSVCWTWSMSGMCAQ